MKLKADTLTLEYVSTVNIQVCNSVASATLYIYPRFKMFLYKNKCYNVLNINKLLTYFSNSRYIVKFSKIGFVLSSKGFSKEDCSTMFTVVV